MIPNEEEIQRLWDTYKLPPYKQIHCDMVKKIALCIARTIHEKHTSDHVNEHLLEAAALLHDIDKNAEKRSGEQHPDTSVRILREEGMEEVAEVVRTHPLHMILKKQEGPKTIEQQILFIADKMTKQDFIGLEKRFEAWRYEDTDEFSQDILDASYPKVVALRDEIFQKAGFTEEKLALLIK